MATSATDLATAEGVKQVIDNLAALEEAVIFAGISTQTDINAGWYGQLSDFEKIVITIRGVFDDDWKIATIEVAATNRASVTSYGATATVIEEPGGFRVSVTNLSSTKMVLRIVGIRSGGGSALADLLAARGVVA